MSERDRPGDWLRRGRFGLTEAERWNADHDDGWDEVTYLEDVAARQLAKNRAHPCIPHEGGIPSEAERIQSPDSAV